MQLFTISTKRYRCDRCGHVQEQSTNHYGPTWSCGRMGVCPACPPWAKYAEFGGQTTWTCLNVPPPDAESIGVTYGHKESEGVS